MKRLLIATAIITALLAGAPAFAHAKVTGTVPEDGSMLMHSPAAIELTFSVPVRLVKLALRGDATGEQRLAFKPSLEAASQFRIEAPALAVDSYRVHWVAMGKDGHKMSGDFQFMQHKAN